MTREQHEEIKNRLIQHVTHLAIPRCHLFYEKNVNFVLSYLERTMKLHGYHVHRHQFQTRGKIATNLECWASSTEVQDVNIIATAHHDAFPTSPGADDNASGMAVLLEVARLLSMSNEEEGLGFVFFDLEEMSMNFLQYMMTELVLTLAIEKATNQNTKDELITKKNLFLEKNKNEYPVLALEGSRQWIHERLATFSNLKAIINLESVGYRDKKPKTQQSIPNASYIPSTGDFLAIVHVEEFRWLFSKLFIPSRNPHLKLLPVRVELENFTFGMRSDHASFWSIGFPALMLTDTFEYRNPHYHRLRDKPDTLDFDFMAAQVLWLAKALPRIVKQLRIVKPW